MSAKKQAMSAKKQERSLRPAAIYVPRSSSFANASGSHQSRLYMYNCTCIMLC